MAAHAITAMNEIVNYKTSEQYQQAIHGIGYAAFGNQFELHDYTVLLALFNLASIPDKFDCAKTAIKDYYWNILYPRLIKEFDSLDCPANYEDWQSRKYAEKG